MKRQNRRKKRPSPARVFGAFAKGFVTTALVAGLQDRRESPNAPRPARKILRHAVQGGIALASATVVADALRLRPRHYGVALTAVAAGAAGVIAAECLLSPHQSDQDKENGLGQKEA